MQNLADCFGKISGERLIYRALVGRKRQIHAAQRQEHGNRIVGYLEFRLDDAIFAALLDAEHSRTEYLHDSQTVKHIRKSRIPEHRNFPARYSSSVMPDGKPPRVFPTEIITAENS